MQEPTVVDGVDGGQELLHLGMEQVRLRPPDGPVGDEFVQRRVELGMDLLGPRRALAAEFVRLREVVPVDPAEPGKPVFMEATQHLTRLARALGRGVGIESVVAQRYSLDSAERQVRDGRGGVERDHLRGRDSERVCLLARPRLDAERVASPALHDDRASIEHDVIVGPLDHRERVWIADVAKRLGRFTGLDHTGDRTQPRRRAAVDRSCSL